MNILQYFSFYEYIYLNQIGFNAYGLDRTSKEDQEGILETSKYRKRKISSNRFLIRILSFKLMV